jgi:putative DNA primase/helicase
MTKIVTESYAIEQLKEYNQWICWGNNTVDSAGKMNKQPFPYGCTQTTDPTNPDLWASYDDCVVWREKRNLRGLGFAFTTDTGIMGIDFDNCVVNNVIDPEVMKIVTHLDSYTEFSPSGNGIHVLIYGSKPKDFTTSKVKLNNGLMMEVYDGKRYFTVTGNHVSGTPDKIHEAHAELADVIEKYRNTDKARSMVHAVTRDVAPIASEYHPTWLERFMENKVASAVNKIGNAVDGNRHDTRRAEARAVGGYYQSCVNNGYRGMSEQTIIDRLYDANVPISANAVKEYRTIEWGFECGLKSPIDLPQMKEKEKPLTTTKSRPTPRKEVEYVTAPEVTEEVAKDDSNVVKLINSEFTEKSVADYFADENAKNVKYSHLTNTWYVWNGSIWEMDNSGGIVYQMVYDIITWIDTEVCASLDEKQRRSVKVKTQTNRFITGVIALIKNRNDVRVLPTDFDMQHDYKPARNGIINLITGELLPHTKEMMFTGMLDFDYTPNAPHHFLDKFLDTVFKGDKELINYVQCASGYSLTGRTDSQAVFFCYGDAQNGKSVFVNKILAHIAGRKFSIETSVNALIENQFASNGSNTEIVGLRNARLSTTAELPKGKRFNSDMVKKIVDGSPISAADKYEKKVTWNSITKLWFTGNHTPNMRDEDNGIWRRFKLIPFGHTITESERIDDTEIMARIQKEEGAILAWMVRGAIAWYANGKKLPECSAVKGGIEELKQESDIIGSFVSNVCDVDNSGDSNMFVRKDLIWVLWQYWTKFNNEKASHNMTRIQFAKSVNTRFKSGKRNGDFYLGLQVKKEYIDELTGIAGSLPQSLAPYTDITKITDKVNSTVEIDNNDTEPTPPTSGFKPLKQPAKVIAPEVVQSSLSINPSTLIDASSLTGKIFALIQANPNGMWASDIADLLGYSGKTERILDSLYELEDKGAVKRVNSLWLLKK